LCPQIYSQIYSPDLLAAVKQGDKFGFIDKKGKAVIPIVYRHVGFYFSEGLTPVETDQELWGYVDLSGKMIIKPQYKKASVFSEGLAAVMMGEDWGYIDRQGELKIKPRFKYLMEFKEGMASVVESGEESENYFYIDIAGKALFGKKRFGLAFPFYGGLALVMVKNTYGYIDKNGNLAIPAEFYAGSRFRQGVALVQTTEGLGWIDARGQYIWKPSR
jgi:hypothetical protein